MNEGVDDPRAVAIACRGLGKQFRDAGRTLDVLQGIDLALPRGQSLAIVGQSGSGKSTLLQLLGGLDRPTAGEVWLMGDELGRQSDRVRTRLRNRTLGFVYQFHHLLAEFSAEENVAMTRALGGATWAQACREARDDLAAVGLAERLDHRPAQLSGGERQRVAIARALAGRPACVLADEPTGNLDQKTGQQVFDLLLARQRDQGTALIVVTHDRALAARADHCRELRDGRLQPPEGPPGA